jgi:hypothetical protein
VVVSHEAATAASSASLRPIALGSQASLLQISMTTDRSPWPKACGINGTQNHESFLIQETCDCNEMLGLSMTTFGDGYLLEEETSIPPDE